MTRKKQLTPDHLDALFGGERARADQNVPGTRPDLKSDIAADAEMLSALGGAVVPVIPPEGLFDKIEAKIDGLEADEVQTLRAEDGEWVRRTDKIWKKLLSENPKSGRSIYLLRCEPGAVIPEHFHDHDEHALVIEGELWMGDLHVRAGDSQFSRAGSVHPQLSSPTGCLILVHV
ncbi:cupin domain-containing protein [Leisingera caerulea]|uniref:Cupin domain-containing protein n=1 Tax=Leisingera caerulea TaxID=506591 RepID=A0A9Q9HND3_LEICA|nr:cupin domain-containing protein [Leisingera caerulea]UWQ55951.1 cupin domain-containing protein [Leisingera caerulea]